MTIIHSEIVFALHILTYPSCLLLQHDIGKGILYNADIQHHVAINDFLKRNRLTFIVGLWASNMMAECLFMMARTQPNDI